MTLDERLREYMRGWFDGLNNRPRDDGDLDDDYRRGYDVGAEVPARACQEELTRMMRCPACQGEGLGPYFITEHTWGRRKCSVCKGTCWREDAHDQAQNRQA